MDISKIKVSGTSYDIKDSVARGNISTESSRIDSIVQQLAGLSTVATSGSYSDLTNKPTIGSGVLTIQKNGTTIDTFNANATDDKTINITIPSAVTLGNLNTTATTAQSASSSESFGSNITLHKIAKTGTYSDLIGKPTKLSDFTDDVGYLTSQDLVTVMDYKGTKATVAALPSSGNKKGDVWHVTENNAEYAWNGSAWEELGTPIDLSGYATTASLAIVATTGSYSDLTGTPDLSVYATTASLATVATTGSYNDLTDKPTIPTVNNAALTIQKNSATVKTFTANASSAVNVDITMQYGGTTGTDAETLILNVA